MRGLERPLWSVLCLLIASHAPSQGRLAAGALPLLSDSGRISAHIY